MRGWDRHVETKHGHRRDTGVSKLKPALASKFRKSYMATLGLGSENAGYSLCANRVNQHASVCSFMTACPSCWHLVNLETGLSRLHPKPLSLSHGGLRSAIYL